MSNRTPEDETLRADFKRYMELALTPLYDKLNIDKSTREKVYETVVEANMLSVKADRKAQATAMLEKGPDNLPPEDKERQPRRCHWAKGFNSSNVEWRSIIKEVGGLDG